MTDIKVQSKATLTEGETVGNPKVDTKTERLKNGNMLVEVTTVFEVENPDEIFALGNPGITMTLESEN